MNGPGYKWVLVALLFVVGALNYCDRTAIASVLPLIRSDLKLSDSQLGAIGSSFLWAYAIASPFGGMLADRRSRSRVIVWSLVAWSLITLATGFVTNAWQLISTRVLLGFVEAAYLPAAMALIADHHPSSSRATAIGLHSAGLAIGIVAGGLGAAYIGKQWGWPCAFYFLGGAGLVLAVIVNFLLHDGAAGGSAVRSEPQAPAAVNSLVMLARIPSFVIILLTCMALAVANNIFVNWLPLYFYETHQMSLPHAAFVGTFMIQSASMIAFLTGGMFSDKFARRTPMRLMLIQVVTGMIAPPFLFAFLAPKSDLILLYCCIFLFSFFQHFGDTSMRSLVCDLLTSKLRSTAFGLMNAASCLSGGFAVILAGFLKAEIGLAGIFTGTSGMTLFSAILMLIGYLFFLRRDLDRRAVAAEADRKGLGALPDNRP